MASDGWLGGGPQLLSQVHLETQYRDWTCWAASINNALACSGVYIDEPSIDHLKEMVRGEREEARAAYDVETTEALIWLFEHGSARGMAVEYGNILERPQDLIPMLQRFWEQLDSTVIARPSPAIPVSVRAEHIIIVGGINVATRRICGFDPDPSVKHFDVSGDEFLQRQRPDAVWLMGQK